jgi:hypothetical protein
MNYDNNKLPINYNDNPLTWKCKLFGCRNEYLPLIYSEPGQEKHGFQKYQSYGLASRTIVMFVFIGCPWCENYIKISDPPDMVGEKWICDCNICMAMYNHE